MPQILRIATRKSQLALWQTHHVRKLLQSQHPGLMVELVPLSTRGDRIIDRPLNEIGGKGLFLKELEQALLRDEADLAVHSMKDIPAEEVSGLATKVVLPRANPADAWLSMEGCSLRDLAPGSRVGTSSLRRQAQLMHFRPDLEVVALRGNVDTRLQKLADGQYAAIILAVAGLQRLGWEARISQQLDPPEWLPAATQGIIALQCREDDALVSDLLLPLHDAQTWLQACAERAVIKVLDGSCQVPLAAFAEIKAEQMQVSALVGSVDGRKILRAVVSGAVEQAEQLGQQAAQELLEQGAAPLLAGLEDAQ